MNNKKRKDGYLKTSFTIDGKRYYVYGRSTKELREKEAQKRAEIEGRLRSRENPTVKEYYERRIEHYKKTVANITYTNMNRDKNAVCNIFINSAQRKFGDLLIKKVTIDDLSVVQEKLLESHSASTVNIYMSRLHKIIKDALIEGIIRVDIFKLLPRLKDNNEKARDTYHRALTIEEQQIFFDSPLTKQSNFYNVFRIAIHTGMRIGEIGALKYKDIKNDYIKIERTITKTEGYSYGIGESTKTIDSRRTIPITDVIRSIIEDQKKVNRDRNGNIMNIDELLFRGPRGGLILSRYVNLEIREIWEHEGLEVFTSHAFRDTFATRAIEQGMNPKTLQAILGHKDFSMTMNLYCHVMEETKINEMKKINIVI